MSERLTGIEILNEGELDALVGSSGDDVNMASVKCVVRELRARRAAELTAEERESLEFAVRVVEASRNLFSDRLADPRIRTHVDACDAALVTLAKILETR